MKPLEPADFGETLGDLWCEVREHGTACRVYLRGVDISDLVRHIKIDAQVGQLTVVALELLPRNVTVVRPHD